MFITFTKNLDHFKNNIQEGFILQGHPVSFTPSISELIKGLMPFWEEYDIEGETISSLRNLLKKHGGLNNEYWGELGKKMTDDFKYNASLSLLLNNIKSASIAMKCFTEVRDNQKINPQHTGYFGEFGIMMKREWIIKNGGSPVIYVDKDIKLTNVLGINLSMSKTLDDCVKTLTGIKSLRNFKTLFDLLSYVEVSDHHFEYEWRIVGEHSFAGKPSTKKKKRITFDFADIAALYVPNQERKEHMIKFLDSINDKKESLPQVYLTKDILLSKEEIESINKIYSRR